MANATATDIPLGLEDLATNAADPEKLLLNAQWKNKGRAARGNGTERFNGDAYQASFDSGMGAVTAFLAKRQEELSSQGIGDQVSDNRATYTRGDNDSGMVTISERDLKNALGLRDITAITSIKEEKEKSRLIRTF